MPRERTESDRSTGITEADRKAVGVEGPHERKSASGAFRAIACRVALAAVSVMVSLVVLELSARIYVATFSGPRSQYDYRKMRPEPYADADYFSKAFIKESYHQPGKWKHPEHTNLIVPSDYSGKYFHVTDGKRVTCFQPEKHDNTVYLFGGSTVYNSEVPDDLTIASWLQKLFNEHFPNKYIVRNYGATSVTTIQQLERLKTLTSFQPGDIVVFYDGVNDINQGVFYANPGKTIVQRNRQTIAEMSFLTRVRFSLSYRTMLGRLFLDPIDYDEPKYLSDMVLMGRLLDTMESRFKETIQTAYRYSTENQALFFHFLQPHLFSDEVFSDYERRLRRNPYLIPRGIEKSFTMGYPRLRNVAAQLAQDINSVDLTDILNERLSGEEYFLDSVHVTHKANQIIATHIFRSISEVLSATDASVLQENHSATIH